MVDVIGVFPVVEMETHPPAERLGPDSATMRGGVGGRMDGFSSLKPMDIRWRDHMAQKLLTPPVMGHTAADMITRTGEHPGWLYFGPDELLFIGDGAVQPRRGNEPFTNMDRLIMFTYEELGAARLDRLKRRRRERLVSFASGTQFITPHNWADAIVRAVSL